MNKTYIKMKITNLALLLFLIMNFGLKAQNMNDIESKIGKANCHYLLEHFDDAITAYEEICEVD